MRTLALMIIIGGVVTLMAFAGANSAAVSRISSKKLVKINNAATTKPKTLTAEKHHVTHQQWDDYNDLNLTCLLNTSYSNVNLTAEIQEYILKNSTVLTALVESLTSNQLSNWTTLIITYPNGTQSVDLRKLARSTPCKEALRELSSFFATYVPQLNKPASRRCGKYVDSLLEELMFANKSLVDALDSFIQDQLPDRYNEFAFFDSFGDKDFEIKQMAQEHPQLLVKFLLENGLLSLPEQTTTLNRQELLVGLSSPELLSSSVRTTQFGDTKLAKKSKPSMNKQTIVNKNKKIK
jgi:hypothetical protein